MKEMKEILNQLKSVFDEYKNPLSRELIRIKHSVEDQLLLIDLGDRVGADLSGELPGHYIRLTENIILNKFFPECGKEIFWSDDGRQPMPGWYLQLSFPTGAYIFNDGYATDSFFEFFNELKSFGPDYLDSANRCLYFSLEGDLSGARQIYKEYNNIFKKYYDLAKKEIIEKRIKEAQDALDKFKNDLNKSHE